MRPACKWRLPAGARLLQARSAPVLGSHHFRPRPDLNLSPPLALGHSPHTGGEEAVQTGQSGRFVR
ncbi:hypothetical protein EN858_16005 [Mesorhizobium sp. M4B.F.Ca.ET.215.01.1.1]|nr:hypothetical protein EOA34_02445 [Mesorhizobium sp. M4B.F.Ca.ET.013.02.1.1]RVC57317.1 hypothetical protein EN779_22125 [Mesorhizobium sp. M4B.F.Ca.ET.088.02.2.1]RVD16534.1 hypothetical protein EN738_29960 [Mesorhizobium sp. M4B.F.Ca.ET.017.02.2.1]RVD38653.1 hypothetical protein EN741_20705 [Mesorhizobium sp. M4B.F.Ca.ET.019.03.1.1]RWA64772.1 MAG: hypothetical protein EOQ27_05500 [Mesorhizobium sp.]RWX70780.1 hypothetical protein EN780_02365 [Mesorhizobium sp. M4B.F.Ca.ET.089.01.1.1]TGQ1058